MKYSCILMLWILLVAVKLPAQAQVTAHSELSRLIANLKPLDIGKDQFFPRSVFKDSEGFIWFGLRNSLLRFDGDSYTEFGYHPVTNQGHAHCRARNHQRASKW